MINTNEFCLIRIFALVCGHRFQIGSMIRLLVIIYRRNRLNHHQKLTKISEKWMSFYTISEYIANIQVIELLKRIWSEMLCFFHANSQSSAFLHSLAIQSEREYKHTQPHTHTYTRRCVLSAFQTIHIIPKW